MTNTETKFRIWCNKEYPTGFIKKVPDFKVGGGSSAGLPDYLVIDNGLTIWYEVKKIPGRTLNLKSHFTDAQKIVFHKMNEQGADIFIYCFTKTGVEMVDYNRLEQNKTISFK